MIPVRNHIASLAAVFLALAVGLALGGGLLAGDTGTSGPPASSGTGSSTPGAGTTDDAAAVAAYAERLVAEGAARLYANGLAGHAVAVLALPGVDQRVLKTLTAQIVLAGGAVTGAYTLGAAVLDPGERSTVDTFGSTMVTQLADPRLDPGASTYARLGQLLGLATATTQLTSMRADTAAVTLRGSLAAAKLLTSPADVRLAPLVLVVLPPGHAGRSADTGALRAMLPDLLNGLTTTATGVVAVADTTSADGGELEALRSGELVGPVSTVDGIETPLGQATTVLALESVLGGTGGSYGVSSKDGPVPLH